MKLAPGPLAAAAVAAVLAVALNCPVAPVPDPEPPEPLGAGLPEIPALRVRVKERLAREVAASRRSLPDAAALFGALDRMPPEPAELYRPDLPDAQRPVEERLCRQVIEWVSTAQGDPDRAVAVARLEAELRDAAARPGGLRLPDPADLEPLQPLLDDARKRLAEVFGRAAGP